MPSPDAPLDRAHEAAVAIADQARDLWLAAHAAGVRDGLEVAALMADPFCDGMANQTDGAGIDTRAIVLALGQFRDAIRLAALQVPDPEPRS